MPLGAGGILSGLSYMALGRETTTGTYNTCTAQLDFISSSVKTTQEVKVLEQIERKRAMSKSISLSRSIGGDVEFYFFPDVTSCAWILQNGIGS